MPYNTKKSSRYCWLFFKEQILLRFVFIFFSNSFWKQKTFKSDGFKALKRKKIDWKIENFNTNNTGRLVIFDILFCSQKKNFFARSFFCVQINFNQMFLLIKNEEKKKRKKNFEKKYLHETGWRRKSWNEENLYEWIGSVLKTAFHAKRHFYLESLFCQTPINLILCFSPHKSLTDLN